MTDLHTAAKQALEALELEEAQTHYPPQWLLKAIAALREALAEQPAQDDPDLSMREPSAIRDRLIQAGWTPPAQRTWVGLTDEELEKLCKEFWLYPRKLLQAIEAKLKEKNA